MEDKKEVLIKAKNTLLDLVKESHTEVVKAKDVYFKLNENYLNLKKRYEEVDRELAMLRRTVLTPTGLGKKVTPVVLQLTIEQIKAIAAKLGIKIAREEGEKC